MSSAGAADVAPVAASEGAASAAPAPGPGAGEVWRARLAAGLAVTLAGLIGALLLGHGPTRASRATGNACDELATLVGAMDLRTLSDQAMIRSGATRFAVALSAQAEAEEEAGNLAAAEANRAVVDQVRIVLADTSATASDLATAITPVAAQCT